MREHQQSHIGEKITCKACHTQVSSVGNLKRHWKIKHSQPQEVMLEKDDSRSICFRNPVTSKSTFQSVDDKKINECHCGSVFKHKRDLTRHQQSHDSEKATCEICGKQCCTISHLKTHLKAEHFQTHGLIFEDNISKFQFFFSFVDI